MISASLRIGALVFSLIVFSSLAHAQATPPAGAPAESDTGTSNDLFVMFGSDLVRPGLEPKANYNIGLGHTFGFLKKDPFCCIEDAGTRLQRLFLGPSDHIRLTCLYAGLPGYF